MTNKKKIKILIYVTNKDSTDMLIKKGAYLKKSIKGSEFTVLYIANKELNYYHDIIENLFETSKKLNANMIVIWSENEALTLKEFINKNNIDMIIMEKDRIEGDELIQLIDKTILIKTIDTNNGKVS